MMLSNEIEASQRLVRTDAYQMSVGEIVNMYRDGEFIINPDFQRLFRWEPGQKSRLIESILLGIPLPPIFVFERDDAKWELVDGLQRISTILEFMGLLKDPDGELRAPCYLEATKYLPSLRNTVWERSDQIADIAVADQSELDKSAQLSIRRARLGVEILKRPSDNKTKFDLFQRLNSGGTPANPQEVRNCIIIMINGDYFKFLKDLSALPSFRNAIALNDEQEERQKHLEYVSRFMAHMYVPYDERLDVEEYIDEAVQQLAGTKDTEEAKNCFTTTFELLNEAEGSNSLRRHNAGGVSGRVGLAAFECIAVGIGKNYRAISQLAQPAEFVKQRIVDIWAQPSISSFNAAGVRGTLRIARSIPFGAAWFKP